jgi:hypothetical protein
MESCHCEAAQALCPCLPQTPTVVWRGGRYAVRVRRSSVFFMYLLDKKTHNPVRFLHKYTVFDAAAAPRRNTVLRIF